MTKRRDVRLIGVPMDLGADHRGVDMGPSALRIAGVAEAMRQLGHGLEDAGDVPVAKPEVHTPAPSEAKYLQEIRDACDQLRGRVRVALEHERTPLVLGGDHAIAIGTVAGVAEHYQSQGADIGLLWIDAHADMNTPQSSPSGNVHGMPLATLLGYGAVELVELGGFAPKVAPRHVALIGVRNLDEEEKAIVRRSGVHAYTMREIDQRGMAAVIDEALGHVCRDTAGFHVSFDLDGLDPMVAPGVGTRVKGGIGWREGNLLMEAVADSGRMLSAEITELNPILDNGNESGIVAVEMLSSAFGKSIL